MALFSKFDILTVQSIIVLYSLIFEHRIMHVPQALPQSVKLTVSENAPLPGNTHNTCFEWLKITITTYIRSVFYKGPLISIITQIAELTTLPALINPNIYWSNVRREVKKNGRPIIFFFTISQALGNP